MARTDALELLTLRDPALELAPLGDRERRALRDRIVGVDPADGPSAGLAPRRGRSVVSRHPRIAIAIVLGVVAVIGASAAGGDIPLLNSRASLSSLSSFSTPGTPVTVPNDLVQGSRIHQPRNHPNVIFPVFTGQAWLVATLGDRTFFRVQTTSGHDCWGAGRVGGWIRHGVVNPFGHIGCRLAAPYFPSPEMPTDDQSIVGQDRGEPAMHYYTIEGLAADGVAAVEGLDASGAVVVRVPVEHNAYYMAQVPATVVKIQPVDHAGHDLVSRP
jgi:hypothetical protein